jgi:hypothetical protein
MKRVAIGSLLTALALMTPGWTAGLTGPVPVPGMAPAAAAGPGRLSACCNARSHAGHLLCLHRQQVDRMKRAVRTPDLPRVTTRGDRHEGPASGLGPET